ncbi:MAG: TolC family protein [Armatimonadota bacterium]
MRKIKLLLLIALTLLLFIGRGALCEESALCLTLDEAVNTALEENKTLDNVKKSISEAKLNYSATVKERYPKFSTGYSYMRLRNEFDLSYPDLGLTLPLMTKDNYFWNSSVSMPVYTGGIQTLSEDIAKLGVDVAKMNLMQARGELVRQVKFYYFNVLRQKKLEDYLTQNAKSRLEHKRLSIQFNKEGLVAKNVVLCASAEEANSRQELYTASRDVEVTKTALQIAMGIGVDKPVSPKDELTKREFPYSMEDCMKYAGEHNPQLVAFVFLKQQAEKAIQIEKAHYIPKVNLSGNYLRYGTNSDLNGYPGLPNNILCGMLNFNWDIFDWGQKLDEAKIKEVKLQEVINEEKVTRDNLLLKIKEAYIRFESAEKSIDTAKAALEYADENLRIVNLRFAQNIAPSSEVVDAVAIQKEAQYNYCSALYSYNMAIADLENLMGQDAEKTLE